MLKPTAGCVAEPVARQLGAPLVPLLTVELSTPEATDCPFGAVDADGNAVLDYRALVTLGLATSEVERIKSRAAEEVRQRLVNHSDGSIETVHYNMYDYDEEKWAAGLRWDAHLRSIFYGETAQGEPAQA